VNKIVIGITIVSFASALAVEAIARASSQGAANEQASHAKALQDNLPHEYVQRHSDEEHRLRNKAKHLKSWRVPNVFLCIMAVILQVSTTLLPEIAPLLFFVYLSISLVITWIIVPSRDDDVKPEQLVQNEQGYSNPEESSEHEVPQDDHCHIQNALPVTSLDALALRGLDSPDLYSVELQ
jgi:hypothetical protein